MTWPPSVTPPPPCEGRPTQPGRGEVAENTALTGYLGARVPTCARITPLTPGGKGAQGVGDGEHGADGGVDLVQLALNHPLISPGVHNNFSSMTYVPVREAPLESRPRKWGARGIGESERVGVVFNEGAPISGDLILGSRHVMKANGHRAVEGAKP